MAATLTRAIGTRLDRIEGRAKVTGQARYAVEYPVQGVAYAAVVQSTIAAGRIAAIDPSAALAVPGVLTVVSHENAPALERVDDGELYLLQDDTVAYRGQIVAAVVAESSEAARAAARLVRIDYEARAHDVVLRGDHPGLYRPEVVNGNQATDTERGDPDTSLRGAAVRLEETYRTPAFHNNPMEPHASLALWEDGDLTIYDSNQGAPTARQILAQVFGMDRERVRIISPHVGGGFGSKGTPRPQPVLAALAARVAGRPVSYAATRQEMFALCGYRTPTISRLRLGADADGRLQAIVHDAFNHSSTVREFAEQTAAPSRVMYAAPHRRTSHRVVRLDVPTPSWMRAPGECPGMFALESAMDELAIACGLDPIELRARNEPESEPSSDKPWSSRHLLDCLREGAQRFGWAPRDPTPGARLDGPWLVGTGVASSTYPTYRAPARAHAHVSADGTFLVQVGAADIGTGARTVLTQIAADALEVPAQRVRVEIGDSALPRAGVAGGSMGTASWGTAVHRACQALRARIAEHAGDIPPDGLQADADTAEEIKAQSPVARHAFGAQFAEVRVSTDTGEVHVPRLLGFFAVGRIINPKTARSQFIGGMTMGLGMALLEHSVMDREFGDYLNHDLAQYHVPACADVADIDAAWLDEDDEQINPMGSKGIGEIGIVGTAAAVANAVHHATVVRVRELPITPDKLVR